MRVTLQIFLVLVIVPLIALGSHPDRQKRVTSATILANHILTTRGSWKKLLSMLTAKRREYPPPPPSQRLLADEEYEALMKIGGGALLLG